MTSSLVILGEAIWPWLAAALATGCIAGFMSWSSRPTGFTGRLAILLALAALAGGAIASLLGSLPGREGLWLDLGLLLTGAFLAGCLLGSLLRRLMRRQPAPPSDLPSAL